MVYLAQNQVIGAMANGYYNTTTPARALDYFKQVGVKAVILRGFELTGQAIGQQLGRKSVSEAQVMPDQKAKEST